MSNDLEANFSLYCQALRIQIRQQKTIDQIQRSACWHRLVLLHHSLPGDYKDPNQLYLNFKQELNPLDWAGIGPEPWPGAPPAPGSGEL